jgi:hypothetical protein
MQRVESTQEFQRTGGNRYTARVLVPDEDEGWMWQDVRRTEWDIHFATPELAIEAATRAVADGTAKRAIVLHWTIEVASEYGWTTNDQPVWRWVRS